MHHGSTAVFLRVLLGHISSVLRVLPRPGRQRGGRRSGTQETTTWHRHPPGRSAGTHGEDGPAETGCRHSPALG